MLIIKHAALEGWLELKEITHIHKTGILIGKALALHIYIQKRLFPHQRRIKIVHHLGMAKILHLSARTHGQHMTVAGLAELLFIKLRDIGTPPCNHCCIIRVIAGSQYHRLRCIELYILSFSVLSYNAAHSLPIHYQLYCRCGKEGFQIRAFFFYIINNLAERITHIQRLGSHPGRPEITVVITVFVTVLPVPPGTGKITAGTDKCAKLISVIQKLCAFRIAVHLAAVAILRFLCKAGPVPEPHHGFLGMIRISP